MCALEESVASDIKRYNENSIGKKLKSLWHHSPNYKTIYSFKKGEKYKDEEFVFFTLPPPKNLKHTL